MKLFHSFLFTVGCLIVIFFVGLSLIRLWPKKVAVDNEAQNLQNKIAEAEQSKSDLARLLDYFKSDSYREREARLRLNYKKPDEQAVFIYRDENAKVPEEKSPEPEQSNPVKWWRWVWQKVPRG